MIFYGSVSANSFSYKFESWGAACGSWHLVDGPEHFIAKYLDYPGPFPRIAIGSLFLALNTHGVGRGICWGARGHLVYPRTFYDLPATYGNSDFNEHLLKLPEQLEHTENVKAQVNTAPAHSLIPSNNVIVRTPDFPSDLVLYVPAEDKAWLPLRASGMPKYRNDALMIPAMSYSYRGINGFVTPNGTNNLCWFLAIDPELNDIHRLRLVGQIPSPISK